VSALAMSWTRMAVRALFTTFIEYHPQMNANK